VSSSNYLGSDVCVSSGVWTGSSETWVGVSKACLASSPSHPPSISLRVGTSSIDKGSVLVASSTGDTGVAVSLGTVAGFWASFYLVCMFYCSL